MTVDVRHAMTSSQLLGRQFSSESWAAWRALLAGFYGLELSDDEQAVWEALTAGRAPPEAAADELWLAIGRRGGKSQAAALLAVYEAAFKDHRPSLAPGERATVMVLAPDRRQARVVFRYVRGLFESNPMLERMIAREERESLELTNQSTIEVATASYRQVRGYTVAAAILDEIAFWHSEDSANPDHEIVAALRPALATLRGKLVALSSPYAKRGALYEMYRRYYGQAHPGVVVAQAPTLTMNPTLPERVVGEARARDPDSAASEYDAQFRTDIDALLSREAVEAAARPDPLELPPRQGTAYQAFVDPAGGGQDEFTLAIGHAEGDRVIVDLVRARKGAPAEIVRDYARVLNAYGVRSVTGDRYAGQWPADEFDRHGVRLEYAGRSKSDLYLDALAVLNSGRIELPPEDRTLTQLANLERRTSRGGRDSVDHPPGGHDDRANVVAGLAAVASKGTVEARAQPIRGLV